MGRKKFSSFVFIFVITIILSACGSNSSSGNSSGESKLNYPKQNITIVAPSGAGGGWDLTARSIAKVLNDSSLVEKSILVENRPGGGGAVFMAEFATKEANNDHMLMVKSPPILINNNKKEGNTPYGFRDTKPLAQLTRDYGAIVVQADSKFKTLKDVLEAIKANPSSVTLAGGSAPGSMDHLIGILPAYKYGIDPLSVKYVSYDGGGEAIAALLGNNADIIATDASTIASYVKSGDVRVLAVSSNERLEKELADVPTFKEAGIDAEFTIWRGVFGPKKMSDTAYKYWEEKISAMVETEEWQNELKNNGWYGEYRNGEEFTKFLEEQEKVIVELLTALGMQK
ncbi:tripartite tricarboxylate transporter substrate binding protein [Caldifermentibacillus hisashii]|jgi:putative tricarboxylic transport membrane protein|uniref:tripartite tricarboxylate transporter substrate binding protein n=1 Tax=Bacillaceae TaxID=186817 RepID=UPI0022E4CE0D|nr:tripartite tricarboxylate transporter substrate binding protein [Caldibacillus thermoamylovorans]